MLLRALNVQSFSYCVGCTIAHLMYERAGSAQTEYTAHRYRRQLHIQAEYLAPEQNALTDKWHILLYMYMHMYIILDICTYIRTNHCTARFARFMRLCLLRCAQAHILKWMRHGLHALVQSLTIFLLCKIQIDFLFNMYYI